MTYMLKHKAVFILLAVGPLFIASMAQAYNAADYNPEHTPYNLEEAIDAKLCKDEVEAFDSDYDALAKSYNGSLVEIILLSGVQGSLDNINAWFEANELYYSTEFRDCIAENTEVEEAAAKKAAQERFEEEQQAKLQKAIEDCDMEYLESLSNSEKMATYDERMACKEKLAAEVEAVTEPTPAPTPVYVPPVVTPEPVIYKAPTTPVQVAPQTITQEAEIVADTSIDRDTDMATTSTSTPKETIEMTEEELDRLIEQRVNEALDQSEPDPTPEPEKPSFFKRVWNFLFGWW